MKFFALPSALIVLILGSFSVQAQEKPVLAVIEFQNQAAVRWWGSGVGEELAGMLSNELVAMEAFRVVERDKLRAVLEEQNLAASGRVTAGSGPAIGRLTGAQYLVMGTVTSYDESAGKTGGGIQVRGVSLGGKQSRAYVAVDLRVVDATSGEVAFTRTIEGTATSGGVSVGFSRRGFGGALANEENTPAGQAIRAALMEIAEYLECAMVKQDRCMDGYRAKDDKRRERTRSKLRL
jgi:curli biogenesis system outer membrane secretion channel CsgG